VATAIGAALGIGGALALSQLVGQSDQNQASAPAGEAQGDQAADGAAGGDSTGSTGTDSEADSQTGSLTGSQPGGLPGAAELAAAGRFELNGLRFEPGSLTLTEEAQSALEVAATAATERPGSSLAIVVRTYSEQTAAANLDLSRSQAQALTDGLIGLGVAPDAITAIGVGASHLAPEQPVPNFVVVGAGLRSSWLKAAVAELNPFAIGIDPAANRLRPESVGQLDRLGQAMAADPSSSVSLAAYANAGRDGDINRSRAAVAAEAVAAYLVSNHGIEPNRIGLLTPGDALYVVPAEAGNHISLRWGEDGSNPTAPSEAEQLALSFPAGSATIQPAAAEVLDGLALDAESQAGTSFVIQVHTATESSPGANQQLGQRQAAAIADYLTDAGLDQTRVRVYGGGNLRQFEADSESRSVITPLP
jgi:outer membrane protein OmpA-like peptidoglycan-associated protein